MALGHVIAIGSRLSYDPNMTQPSALKTFLWFQNDLEEALAFYRETFKDVVVREENRMGEGAPLFTADFTIFGHEFIGMCIKAGRPSTLLSRSPSSVMAKKRPIAYGQPSRKRVPKANVVGVLISGESAGRSHQCRCVTF